VGGVTVRGVAMREVLIRIALVAGSCVLVLLVAEGVLRVHAAVAARGAGSVEEQLERSERSALGDAEDRRFGLRGLVRASRHPGVVYELKPGLRGTFQGRRIRTSSQALRDREYEPRKSTGTVRIVGLGDSVMFGWGVDRHETYLEVLERRLNQDVGGGRRFEVLNFAVPGYNTAMEVAAFEHKALAFAPDVVILHFVDNDLRLPQFMLAPRDVRTWKRSYLFELIGRRPGIRPSLAEDAAADGLVAHGLEELPPEDRQEVRERHRPLAGEAGFRRAVARLADLTREAGIEVLVLRLSDQNAYRELVDEAIARHGFHAVTAAGYFQAHLRDSVKRSGRDAWAETFWVSDRDHHPNALGHRLYAEAIWNALGEIGVR